METPDSKYTLPQQFMGIVRQNFRRLLRKRNWATFLVFITIVLLGFMLTGLLESFFYLQSSVKITFIGLTLGIATVALWYYRNRLHLPTFKEFYHQFGKQTNHENLSDALDLFRDNDAGHSSFHNAAIRQNLEQLSPDRTKSELKNFIKAHPVHRTYSYSLATALTGLLLLTGFTLFQPSAAGRLAHPWISYSPPNPYSYSIEPGTITLEQGESFTPKITFGDAYPEQLTLAFKTDIEENFRERNATAVDQQKASFAPISLTTNGHYYFVMDGFKSATHRVRVQLRPRLEQLQVDIVPPAYTRLDTSSYTYPFSQIRAYPGSELHWSGTTNKPVAQLSVLRTAPADTIKPDSLQDNGNRFAQQWTVTETDTVSVQMSDSAGLSNKNNFRFVVEPREDQYPFVNLEEPSDNLKMKTPEKVSLTYEAGDDFGLTSASLHFELQRAFTDQPQKGAVSLSTPPMNQPVGYEWDVPSLDPKPRDVLTYWIAVRDNDGYSGAKTGTSQKLMITFPSVTEYMDELESKEKDVSESLDNISDSFDQMQQEYNRFKEQLKRNPETDYQQKKQLEEVDKKRQEIDKQVNDLNKKFEDIRKEIEKNNALSPETLESYQELQKLMNEINSPELQKALEELQKSLGNMSPEQMRKALENYEFNEELYKQRINRTKELFKSLKLNSDLEKMAQSLEELAKQEQQVSESDQNPGEDLEQQEAISNDLNKLQKQVEQLDENTPEKARDQVQELRNNSQQQLQQTREQLEKNMEQLRQQKQNNQQQKSPETRQQQQQIQQQMQQMAQQMRDAKQQFNQQQRQVNAAGLKYILYSLINLSTNQEELTKESENLPSRSKAFVEKARRQKNISAQFTTLSDSLYQLSSEIPSFSNRINKKKTELEGELTRAVDMLAERDQSNATYAQRQSLGGINELSTMLASLLDQLQNQQGQGSGGGMSMQQFMEQMKKMSGQQQQLNQQIQDMINDIQGNRLSQDQMDRLNQMSKQQNRIRKQLKELQRKGELESGDRVLSELERMSEQMEDAINDLRGGQLDQQLMQRQQNILSRMLSAEKAVQERGKEDRREATTAEENQQSVPPDLTLEDLQKRIRKMLNDPDRTKFSEDYQRLIEQYFKLLKEQKKGAGTK